MEIQIYLTEKESGELQTLLSNIESKSYSLALEDPMDSRPLQINQNVKLVSELLDSKGVVVV